MRRGEVWWANLPAPAGRRPVLLLSRDAAYGVRTAATVAAITRTIRNIPVEVELPVEDGMPAQCVVNVDQILTIPMFLLDSPITTLDGAKLTEVREAIVFALDLQ